MHKKSICKEFYIANKEMCLMYLKLPLLSTIRSVEPAQLERLRMSAKDGHFPSGDQIVPSDFAADMSPPPPPLSRTAAVGRGSDLARIRSSAAPEFRRAPCRRLL